MSVVSNQVTFTMSEPPSAVAQVSAGKVRALAVTAPARLPELPDVPTMKEAGFDVTVSLWAGLFAPAGTPAEIVKRLEAECARISQLPDFRQKLRALSTELARYHIGRIRSGDGSRARRVARCRQSSELEVCAMSRVTEARRGPPKGLSGYDPRRPECPLCVKSAPDADLRVSPIKPHSTKSLCDIGGCGLVLSAVPRKEIVDGGAPRMIGHRTIRNFTPKNSSAITHNKSFR